MDTNRIISHGHKLLNLIAATTSDVAEVRVALKQFQLGRFLLENLGLNGFWTSYIVMYPDRGALTGLSSDGTQLTDLERWILERCPFVIATQDRFRIFRRLTQSILRSDMQIASLPAGLMDDLLTLDYSDKRGVVLTAVDLDSASLSAAQENYGRLMPPVAVEFERRDAWQLDVSERWDIITSSGLNIYVEDDQLCTDFYRNVWRALKPGGVFILSFLTLPQQWQPYDALDLDYQRHLFTEVVPVKWSCFRDENQTRQQLAAAGFEVVNVSYDTQRIFPSVLARKVSANFSQKR